MDNKAKGGGEKLLLCELQRVISCTRHIFILHFPIFHFPLYVFPFEFIYSSY